MKIALVLLALVPAAVAYAPAVIAQGTAALDPQALITAGPLYLAYALLTALVGWMVKRQDKSTATIALLVLSLVDQADDLAELVADIDLGDDSDTRIAELRDYQEKRERAVYRLTTLVERELGVHPSKGDL